MLKYSRSAIDSIQKSQLVEIDDFTVMNCELNVALKYRGKKRESTHHRHPSLTANEWKGLSGSKSIC
jgi:hypothetical protein